MSENDQSAQKVPPFSVAELKKSPRTTNVPAFDLDEGISKYTKEKARRRIRFEDSGDDDDDDDDDGKNHTFEGS